MPIWRLLLACLALLLLACGDGFASTAGDSGSADAARPAGWQSLDDEAEAQRLYYQFVDARGQVRFVESLDDVPESSRAGVGFVKMAVAPPLSPGDAHRARVAQVAKSGGPAASGSGPRVVLYSANWCGACRKAKRYLDAKGVDYEERNIDEPRYAQELVEKTGQRGIPVIEVDGRVLTGFSAARYDELIGRA
jgi:glutaredoxin